MFAEDELRAIVEAAGEAGSLISIDEAYFPFYDKTALPWLPDYEHLIVLRSTSKAWALAGLRIGYAVAAPEIADAIQKVRPMFEINSLAVEVFLAMLDHYDAVLAAVKRLNDGKAYFRAEMDRMGFVTFPCEGNFQHVGFGEHSEKIHAALADVVLYRTDTDMPCLAGFSRFSVTTVGGFKPVVDAIAGAIGATAGEAAE